ncbi:hypothetical protein DFS34DRAFT_410599 [Phlyctochytrium arcticum]|nr:hypothetical protein DFS34DRAFT_410599 [Phlyctochytrium arcticum]
MSKPLKPGTKKLEDLKVADTFTRNLTADPLSPYRGSSLLLDNHRVPSPSSETRGRARFDGTGGGGGGSPGSSPIDASQAAQVLRTPRTVRGAFFTFLDPIPCPDATLVAYSPSALAALNLAPDQPSRPEFTSLFASGANLPQYARPWATNYGGHQFGIYAGQLGDGRCLSLFESVTEETHERWDIQLKGSGITAYSRFGDGATVLRSSIREFLCSETMNALGIPTTRGLAIFGTRQPVYREDVEAGALLVRLSPSWIRFGSFELFHYRNERDKIRELADYVIRYHFPDLLSQSGSLGSSDALSRSPSSHSPPPIQPTMQCVMPEEGNPPTTAQVKGHLSPPDASTTLDPPPQQNNNGPAKDGGKMVTLHLNQYAQFFQKVIRQTAKLIACWQAVGFVHGVLNTDNMSILGLTLDYGPFGFLDTYDPYWTSNAADSQDRYRFEHQPKIAMWNLSKLGRTLADLMTGTQPSVVENGVEYYVRGEEIVRDLLKDFEPIFVEQWTGFMRAKLGLTTAATSDLEDIILPLLQILSDTQADYTTFFRSLCEFRCTEAAFQSCITFDAQRDAAAREVVSPLQLSDPFVHLVASARRSRRMATQGLQNNMSASVSNLDASMTGAKPTSTTTTTTAKPVKPPPPPPPKPQTPPSVDDSDVPSDEEVIQRWQDWASSYRSRLTTDFTAQAKIATLARQQPPSVDVEDMRRAQRMKKCNPKYVLRGWIAEEIVKKVQDAMTVQQNLPALPTATPTLAATTTTKPPRPSSSSTPTTSSPSGLKRPASRQTATKPSHRAQEESAAFAEVARAVRVLIDDIWGDVAESPAGWADEEDRKAAERWAGHVPDWALNMVQTTMS